MSDFGDGKPLTLEDLREARDLITKNDRAVPPADAEYLRLRELEFWKLVDSMSDQDRKKVISGS